MSISASVFDQWIGALDGGSALSMRQVGKMSGVSSGHLSVSRTRGVMPSAAVLGVAQAYGLDPLEEIARFPGFEIARRARGQSELSRDVGVFGAELAV